jgi:hypothetical protein
MSYPNGMIIVTNLYDYLIDMDDILHVISLYNFVVNVHGQWLVYCD